MNRKTVSDRVLDWIYPRRCPLCDRIIENPRGMLCSECKPRLRFLKEPLCMKCGRSLENRTEEYCKECIEKPHRFVASFAPFAYRAQLQESILRMKYHQRAEYADFFGKSIAFFGKEKLQHWKPELILPVPLHPSRARNRGYNQAELIAKAVGKECGIPVDASTLKRNKKTRPQKELSYELRCENLRSAFSVSRKLTAECVLIVDDIFTTGSTMDTISELLAEKGVRRIYGACAAVAETLCIDVEI